MKIRVSVVRIRPWAPLLIIKYQYVDAKNSETSVLGKSLWYHIGMLRNVPPLKSAWIVSIPMDSLRASLSKAALVKV